MRIVLLLILALGIVGVMAPGAFSEKVPEWVKNTAGWWATDSISEVEFVNAIEFLVNEKIIQVNSIQSESSSQGIPEWVKNTAGWWATDSISEVEFVNAIEFLVVNGIISIEKKCSSNIDNNENNIPDILENQMPEFDSIREINDLDFSNCDFPNTLSSYDFRNVDFSNSDLSNANLFNTRIAKSTLHNTDFSNSKLHGVIFAYSTLDGVIFNNTEFSAKPEKFDRVMFSLNETSYNYNCTFLPCEILMFKFEGLEQTQLQQFLFGKNTTPLNLFLDKLVLDSSDTRATYFLVPSFIGNGIKNIDFGDANLSHSLFVGNNFNNVDFSKSILSKAEFRNSNFYKTQFSDVVFEDEFIEMKNNFKMNYNFNKHLPNLTFHTDYFKSAQLKNSIGYPMINWSMGMLIDGNNLIVANTDDHSIDIFDIDDFKLLQTFSSPIQFECETTNTWSKSTECTNEKRNLPTSISKFKESIFVAYGWQNEIQVFDVEGDYLYSFGQKGNDHGEFIEPFNIFKWEEKLYVLDSGNNRIQIFDENSNYENEFSTDYLSNNNSKPKDFSIYENEIFVTYNYDTSISRFDLEGELIEIIDLSPYVDSNSISSLHVNDGLIGITDSSEHRIMIFDLSGNLQIVLGESGNEFGQFMNPRELVFEDNLFFVSDTYNYRIQIFEIMR